MKKWTCFLLIAFTVASLFAQTGGRDKPASEREPSEDLAALQTANSLAKYGYSNSSASALICAAEILAQIQTQELSTTGKQTAPKGPSKVSTPEFTVANLLADAKKMASKDKTMLDWIASIEKSLQGKTRGAVGGPKTASGVVFGGSSVIYQLPIRANEVTEIVVVGNGATDLDLYVYDINGKLVVADERYSDNCYVWVVPQMTTTIQVEVFNRGRVANRYEIYTN